jgi:hypothetical protein
VQGRIRLSDNASAIHSNFRKICLDKKALGKINPAVQKGVSCARNQIQTGIDLWDRRQKAISHG